MDEAGQVGVLDEEGGRDKGREQVDSNSLDLTIDPFIKDANGRAIAYFPSRVLSALDHASRHVRRDVERAVRAFAYHHIEGTALPAIDPVSGEEVASTLANTLYIIPATPQFFLIVRRGHAPDEAPVVVEDIVTRALWDYLAHAG